MPRASHVGIPHIGETWWGLRRRWQHHFQIRADASIDVRRIWHGSVSSSMYWRRLFRIRADDLEERGLPAQRRHRPFALFFISARSYFHLEFAFRNRAFLPHAVASSFVRERCDPLAKWGESGAV